MVSGLLARVRSPNMSSSSTRLGAAERGLRCMRGERLNKVRDRAGGQHHRQGAAGTRVRARVEILEVDGKGSQISQAKSA